MKFKQYQEQDWLDAQRILKEAKASAGALVSETSYSWLIVCLNLIKMSKSHSQNAGT